MEIDTQDYVLMTLNNLIFASHIVLQHFVTLVDLFLRYSLLAELNHGTINDYAMDIQQHANGGIVKEGPEEQRYTRVPLKFERKFSFQASQI